MTLTPTTGCPYRLDATGSDIQGEVAALRALGPAVRTVLPGGIPVWTVTDPGLIRRLLVHPDISKDAHQHWPAYITGEIPAGWPQRVWVDVRNALTAYGDEHTRLRRPLARAFGPRRVRALTPQIETITGQLLDELQKVRPEDVVDLRARFTWRLPLLVIDTLFQTPEHLHEAFRDAAGSLFATDLTPQAAKAAHGRVYALISELIDYKRDHPGDDLSSDLIAARDAGRMSDQELADSFVLIISAGHETTVNALGHAVVNLITHPEQLALATSGQASWRQVVEETLRHQAPIATIILRFAAREVIDDITGVTFAAGDAIAISYAAAGRDPATHGPNADNFDVTRRTAPQHLAFGYGAHLCVGAELARIEARIGLQQLFARFPSLRLAVEPSGLQPLPSYISNGHQRLPVHLGPHSQ
ncbi:cytochrome P450 [Streptomyces sp. NPDC006476]|uniref:cytochrome P450 family protein n=1 Tax=Streptomyces sp. NPDC006476 TaxID=3157175 RepID=UPI0033B152A0